MKLFFNLIFFILFCNQALAKEYISKYEIRTKGFQVGVLKWEIILNEKNYEVLIELKNKGMLSGIYKFDGRYRVEGSIVKGLFYPKRYEQNLETKKKKRDVELIFENNLLSHIMQEPKEIEIPRIKYKNLKGYRDPLTSFLNILINKTASFTIDGRRAYLLNPTNLGDKTKILVGEYNNIWTDHNNNDLEFIEVYENELNIFPKKINIKFNGMVFSLENINS